MKVSTVAILLTATLQSSAEECGYGGCTEYSTYETTTPVVTYYTTTYQSVCTTPIVYKPTKVKTITVTSTYTKPGETKKVRRQTLHNCSQRVASNKVMSMLRQV